MERVIGGQEQGERNLLSVLETAARFGGWITANLAGLWCWPDSMHQTKRAEQVIRRAVDRELLLPRKLGGRRHAYVLTVSGCRALELAGIAAKPGTKWGRVTAAGWRAPEQLDHHERALQYLGDWKNLPSQEEMFVRTDHELAMLNPGMRKRPDGLTVEGDHCTWIEVEGSRKTGAAMRIMCQQAIEILTGRGPWMVATAGRAPLKPNAVAFVLPANGRDDRGYRLDHRQRVLSGMRNAWVNEDIEFDILQPGLASGYVSETIRMGDQRR